MEASEYDSIFDRENDYSWYRGLHELVLLYVKEIAPSGPVHNAGCGTGRMLELSRRETIRAGGRRHRAQGDPVLPSTRTAEVFTVGYWPTLGRYFVSEDFVCLRFFAGHLLWQTTWAHFTGPLFGITFVKFYRPVAVTLLNVEYLVWSSEPFGYVATHLAFHALNVFLFNGFASFLPIVRLSATGTAPLSVPLVVHSIHDHGTVAVISSLPSHANDDTIFRIQVPKSGKSRL